MARGEWRFALHSQRYDVGGGDRPAEWWFKLREVRTMAEAVNQFPCQGPGHLSRVGEDGEDGVNRWRGEVATKTRNPEEDVGGPSWRRRWMKEYNYWVYAMGRDYGYWT